MSEILTEILSSDPDIEVVGVAADAFIARNLIKTLQPNVLTLDVEMPRMDGLTFLEKLMRAYPIPVVMISSLTEKGCDTTLGALSLGAIDYVAKPKLDIRSGAFDLTQEIIDKVKAAARARVIPRPMLNGAQAGGAQASLGVLKGSHKILAIGASTGTEALREFLEPLPPDVPPIVFVQHMPEKYTGRSQTLILSARSASRRPPMATDCSSGTPCSRRVTTTWNWFAVVADITSKSLKPNLSTGTAHRWTCSFTPALSRRARMPSA